MTGSLTATAVARDLFRARHFIVRLVLTALRTESRQSLFGFAAGLVPAAAITFVICAAQRQNSVVSGGVRWPLAAYVATGVLIWQTFADAVQAPIRTLSSRQHYLSRLSCAVEAVFAARLAELGGALLLRFAVAVAVLRLTGVPIGLACTAALLPLSILMLAGFGAGMIVAPFCSLYRDLQQFVTYALVAWFAITPIAYVAPAEGLVAAAVRMNPAVPLFRASRDLLRALPVPLDAALAGSVAAALFLFAASWIVFRIAYPFVAERCNT